MLRALVALTCMAFGFVCVVGGMWQREADTVSALKLAEYTGGEAKWCMDPIIDLSGTDCNKCVAIAGGSTKCFATNRDESQSWHAGQSPAVELDLQVTNCGGQGQNYTSADCTTGPSPYLTCVRQYDYNVALHYSMAVNCPPL